MKIAIIDNYDSFTYNLVHLVEEIVGERPDVIKNDKAEILELEQYDMLILSPGPGLPSEAGKLKEIITTYAHFMPMLGVCLGLQAVVEVFGGKLQHLDSIFHGVAGKVIQTTNNAVLYKDMPLTFEAARYHSWVASVENFPEKLEVTAIDDANNIMSARHKKFPLSAVQYHPESILTPLGKKIMTNFINTYKDYRQNE